MPRRLEIDASLAPSEQRDPPLTFQKRPAVLGVVEAPQAGMKARQLFEEARMTSLEHLRALELAIASVRDLSAEIVRGGDLYAPGLRELARTLAEDLLWKGKTLEALSQRQGDRRRASA